MSLFFNKEEPVFDEYGFDDDGWTREDYANLAKYGAKNPTSKMIAEREERERKEKETGRWY